MGSHKLWRAQAKKMRRKRIRQQRAQERDTKSNAEQALLLQSPRYQVYMSEQKALEIFQREEEAHQELLRHKQWLKNEELAKIEFGLRVERQALARQERIKQEKLIREEWEAEQTKLKAIEAEKKMIEDEKKRKQEELMQQIDDFIKKGDELPPAAIVSTETNPDKPVCPFFTKTGACRFGDRCSRNHKRPGISRVILIPSFYSHFGISQSRAVEYDTDLMLEYEDSDTYGDFLEFYNDVLPEFEEHGDVIQFKVCCNSEPHLRGNVYVEFTTERYAVKAYQKFHGRYFGGRQLNVEFTAITSWKSALCGMHAKKCCPKGRNCNFLHVFRNPGNRFSNADRDGHRPRLPSQPVDRSASRASYDSPPNICRGHTGRGHWRWSESPPPASPPVRKEHDGSNKRRGRERSGRRNGEKRSRSDRRDSSSRSSRRSDRRRKSRSRS